ncbi:hypothetical protein [Enterococcus innesii]|uniref:hypothetical protein n=1 Tax=Enterococcus innesii TaxID=2839759 RepID=UPI002DB6EA32|nr:hypothetical protein [Enterococcus innesii]MEB5953149.1 hypothetical protein [Enterococcus innesii]
MEKQVIVWAVETNSPQLRYPFLYTNYESAKARLDKLVKQAIELGCFVESKHYGFENKCRHVTLTNNEENYILEYELTYLTVFK